MKQLFLALVLGASPLRSFAQPAWTAQASLPALARQLAVGFSLNNKGYVCTGIGPGGTAAAVSDLWEFDPLTNTWTQKADLPGGRRARAAGAVLNGRAYVGMGTNYATQGYVTDWWEYNPAANTWTARASVPGRGRSDALAFAVNNRVYVGGGVSASPATMLTDFHEYDPATNTWTAKATLASVQSRATAQFVLGSLAYVAGGTTSGATYAYNAATDTWLPKASFPPGARFGMTGFAVNGKGYAGLGRNAATNTHQDDWWEYNPTTDAWTQQAAFTGGARSNAAAFSIGNQGYVAAGSINGGFSNELWSFRPVITNTRAPLASAPLSCWPIPTSGLLHLSNTPAETARLYDAQGRLVKTLALTQGQSTADLSRLPAGTYLLRCGTATRRLVVRP